MSKRRTVPVAYVTKWATTRGIVVVRDAERSESFPECLILRVGFMHQREWTEDRAEAERRWRKAMEKERARLVKKQAALAQALKDGPRWEDA